MIRFLRAFVWLRWRLLVNGLRGGKRRDLVEDVSRAAGAAVPIIFVAFFAASATGFAWLALQGGLMVGAEAGSAAAVFFAARLILLFLLVILFLVPLVRSMSGSTLGIARFLLLPVPRAALHAVEVAAVLLDPWMIAVAPGLVAFAIGLAASGAFVAAAVTLAAVAAFLALCASLGALLSFLLAWLLRDRRRAEIVTLAFMLVLMTAGAIPALLDPDTLGKPRDQEAPRAPGMTLEQLDARLPAWTALLPSEICVRAARAGLEGEAPRGILRVFALAAEAAALFLLGGAVHRRLLGSVDSGGARRAGGSRDAREIRIPGLGPAATAVAVAQVRASLRTIIGRLAILGMAPMVLVIGMLVNRAGQDGRAAGLVQPGGYVIAAAGMLFSLMTLQPILMNQLASDRAGLTLQFLQPLGDREIVFGKAAGGFALFGACALLSLGAGVIVNRSGGALAWLSALLAGVATYVWTAPVAALLSEIFPKASNLSSLGTAAKAHGATQFFGALATIAAAAPPALVLLFVTAAPGGEARGLTLLVVWTLLAAIAAVPLLGAAARLLAARRENIALVASGR